MGRHVKTLIENYETAGFKMVKWDATNNNGNNVSAGMYIYQIRAGAFNDTKKMVLLK
jgi:flagellar hook assembly protein FlgD